MREEEWEVRCEVNVVVLTLNNQPLAVSYVDQKRHDPVVSFCNKKKVVL